MEKRLKIFIVIAVVLIVIIGSVRIKQEIETSAGTLTEAKAETKFGISEEGQIYVIGTHLFTENIPYLSTEMMLTAAKTIEGLPVGLEDEEILNRITVYARDAKGNWIDALKGTKINLAEDFEFDIKYVDLKPVKAEEPIEPEDPAIEIATEEELKEAFKDTSVNRISIKENIKITENIDIEDRTFTIELNDKEMDLTGIDAKNAISIKGDSKLIINSNKGKIKTGENIGLYNEGTLEINNLLVTGAGNPIYTESSTDKQAITTINDSNINGSGVYCLINRSNATTNVNDSEIIANIPLGDNGLEHNSIFNINNSIITGTETAIYKPASGKLNVINSTLSGETGIVICSGDLSIENSTISGNGNYREFSEVTKQTGGFDSEGSAILIGVRRGYNDGSSMKIEIDEKTTINSANGNGIRISENEKNNADKHGPSEIKIDYYSSKINSIKERVKLETLGGDYLAIEVNNLDEIIEPDENEPME